jgi:Fe-S oxidoreductase
LFGAKMIYFRGCVAREKLGNISRATEEILKHAGIDYKVLENEKCCGSFLLRTGFREEAEKVMNKTLKDLEGEKIVTSCAGCYRTFKKDYKEILGVEINVVHTSELFNQLIEHGKIELEFKDKKVTYHDPCHLGREMEEYDAPRAVIYRCAELVEMDFNKDKARCCGAGGGVRSAYPEITEEISMARIEDAKNTGTEIIITACPFCILNIQSVCIEKQSVLDISELVLNALKDTPGY